MGRSWSAEVLAPAFNELSPAELRALAEDQGEEGDAMSGAAYLAKHEAVLEQMKERIEQLREDFHRSASAKSPKVRAPKASGQKAHRGPRPAAKPKTSPHAPNGL